MSNLWSVVVTLTRYYTIGNVQRIVSTQLPSFLLNGDTHGIQDAVDATAVAHRVLTMSRIYDPRFKHELTIHVEKV